MFKFKCLQQGMTSLRFGKISRHLHKLSRDIFKVSEEVYDSILNKKPLVALESTVITHGLPYPENLKCALRLEDIVRQNRAVPATIGILNGVIYIGMDAKEIEKLASAKENVIKVSRRDLPYVLSKKLNGGTTVAATMILAHKVGIPIFVTGGIGGVHRGAEKTMDISADLYELSRTPMTVVSAGVKSILDIGLTLEYLETLGVCIATYGKSVNFPSFFTQNSGFHSSCNVETVKEAASLINSRDSLQLDSGLLLAVPIPEEYQNDGEVAHSVIEKSLEEAKLKNITGKNITPFVLKQVHSLSEGASLRANIGLLENNAHVGSQIAVELSEIYQRGGPTSSRTLLSPVKQQASKVISSSSRPVIVGGSILDIHVKVQGDIKMDGRTIGGKVQSTAGGVGRNLADCMARLGADPLFISVVGAQEYAETLLSKMDHVDKKGIKILENARTATCVVILDNKGESAFYVGDMSIHDQLLPLQVEMHEDAIATASVVVVDGNIPLSTMNYLLNLCAKHQIPVWFEPTDISCASKAFEGSAWRSALAYASPNINELRIMHNAIFHKALTPVKDDCLERKIEDSLLLGAPLLTDTFHTLVVTLASHGILLITKLPEDVPFPVFKIPPKVGKVRAVHYPATIPENIVSVSGAGDCFAAAMVAGIIKGLHPDDCIRAGQRAAVVSLASHHAVPTSMCRDTVFPSSTCSAPLKKHPIPISA